MLRTRILRGATEFRQLRSIWEQFAGQGTIFQSYGWNRIAAECFAGREDPYVICCESDSGCALIPAVLRGGSIGLLGEALFDYRDVLFSGDQSVLVRAWQELCELHLPFSLTALRGEQGRVRWWRATPRPFAYAPCVSSAALCNVPKEADATPAVFAGADDACDRMRLAEPPLLSATLPRGAFENCREAFLRGQARLRLHSRRIGRQGIMLRRHTGAEHELVRMIYDNKTRQREDTPNLFQDRSRREFMVRIAAEEGARCEIFTYECGVDLVAALVTFRDDATRHFYTTYHDPRWAKLSPGQVLLFEATAESLANGLDCDYMTGEYPYKNRLANARVPLFTVEIPAEEMRDVFIPETAATAAACQSDPETGDRNPLVA